MDWTADGDWDWHSAADDTTEQLRTLWQDAVDRSRSLVAQALQNDGLDLPARRHWPDGRAPSRRWILVHIIEEYVRHNGHSDLLRESLDGQTGEYPMIRRPRKRVSPWQAADHLCPRESQCRVLTRTE